MLLVMHIIERVVNSATVQTLFLSIVSIGYQRGQSTEDTVRMGCIANPYSKTEAEHFVGVQDPKLPSHYHN
jgi:hypothetical protein